MLNTNETPIAQDYTCPNCGGKTNFNPSKQTLQCLYCNSEININDKSISEQSLEVLFKEAGVWEGTEVIKCNKCGCEEVVAKGQISTSCSFCGTNNVVKTSQIVGMKPHGVCPFKKSLIDVKQITEDWVRGKIFAPNAFKKTARSKDLKGIYSPAFTFDCRTNTTYSGRLGKTEYYTTRGLDGKLETHSRTIRFSISGNYQKTFDDFLVQAASSIPETTLDKISPFPTGEAVEYDEKYLAGYTANTYSKDGKQTWAEGQRKMEARIEKDILRKYDHDRVYSFDAQTGYNDVQFKYLLLPLYVGHHSYKGKNYNFYINGSTGKIDGKAPISAWKVLFLILGILGIIGIIVLLVLIFSGVFS